MIEEEKNFTLIINESYDDMLVFRKQLEHFTIGHLNYYCNTTSHFFIYLFILYKLLCIQIMNKLNLHSFS